MTFVPFDRGTLQTKLSELRDILAELNEIDRLLDYLNANFDTFRIGGIAIIGPGTSLMEVEIGRTYPFTKSYAISGMVGNSTSEMSADMAAIETAQQEAATGGRGFGDTVYGILNENIEQLIAASPGDYQPVYDGLVEAHGSLEATTLNDFADLDYSKSEWEGPAADNFSSAFYTKLPEIRTNQAYVLEIAISAVSAAQAVNDMGQQSLMNVIVAMHEAVDEQLRLREQENPEPTVKEALALASSATGLIGAVSFAAPPVATGFGIVSATLGLASAAIPDDKSTPLTVTSSTALESAFNLYDRIDDIKSNVASQLDGVQTETNRAKEQIERWVGSGEWVPRGPDVANGSTPQDFRHESSTLA